MLVDLDSLVRRIRPVSVGHRFNNGSAVEQTLKESAMQPEAETHSMFKILRESTNADVADAIEALVRDAPDHKLCRINVLDFASKAGLNEEQIIAAFLHSARIGLFELSWNVLCPACGGVLDPNATLKTVRRERYECELCAAGYKVTL